MKKKSQKVSSPRRKRSFWSRFRRKTEKVGAASAEHLKDNLITRAAAAREVKILILEWSATIFVCLLLASLQAVWFHDSYTTEAAGDGGTFIEATLGDVDSLNPLFASTSSEKALSRLMFEGLTKVDSSGHIGLALAKSVKKSEDAKTWTIELKDNLTWSDSEPLTADDVIFTANAIQKSNSSYSSNLTGVEVSKTSDEKIIFKLKNPYVDFDSALTFPILPAHAFESQTTSGNEGQSANTEKNQTSATSLEESDFNSNPISSGAYVFNAIQTSATGQKTIYLEKNPHYYRGEPRISTFAVRSFNSEDEIAEALESGSVTGSAEIKAEKAETLAESSSLKLTAANYSGGAFLFINTTGTLNTRALRTALEQGINKSEVRTAAPGASALDYPLLENQIEIKNYPELPTYSKDTAAETLSDAGVEELSLATVNSGYLPAVAEKIKSELENLGLKVNLTVYEENQDFIKNIVANRAYDLLLYEIDLGVDPDLMPYYHSSQASASGLNLSNYKNPSVDDLLLTARQTTDPDFRAEKYEAFLEYWVRDVPAIGLYQSRLTYLSAPSATVFNPNTEKLASPLDRFNSIRTWSAIKTTKNRTP